jgi:hypothetical protein
LRKKRATIFVVPSGAVEASWRLAAKGTAMPCPYNVNTEDVHGRGTALPCPGNVKAAELRRRSLYPRGNLSGFVSNPNWAREKKERFLAPPGSP